MSNIIGLFRKSLKRGTNVVRRVGKLTRKTVKRGTNTLGLTKKSRRHRRKSHKGRRQH